MSRGADRPVMAGPVVEQVWVVPRDRVVDDGWRGIRSDGAEVILEAIRRAGRFAARPVMERDPAFKQVIPYVVLRDGPRWFLMRRTRAGADRRLHERYSVGVGGHINPVDDGADVLRAGLLREWQEELVAGFVPDFRLLGFLNDDTTEVGAVHLGVVYVAEAAGRPVGVRETGKLRGSFAELAEVQAAYDRMETWSQLVVDFLADRPAGGGRSIGVDAPGGP